MTVNGLRHTARGMKIKTLNNQRMISWIGAVDQRLVDVARVILITVILVKVLQEDTVAIEMGEGTGCRLEKHIHYSVCNIRSTCQRIVSENLIFVLVSHSLLQVCISVILDRDHISRKTVVFSIKASVRPRGVLVCTSFEWNHGTFEKWIWGYSACLKKRTEETILHFLGVSVAIPVQITIGNSYNLAHTAYSIGCLSGI